MYRMKACDVFLSNLRLIVNYQTTILICYLVVFAISELTSLSFIRAGMSSAYNEVAEFKYFGSLCVIKRDK